MRTAIVWICAVVSLCGSIDGSVLRVDGTKNTQLVEAVTNPVLEAEDDYADSENKIEENFERARQEQPVEITTEKLLVAKTQRTIDPEQVLAEIQKKITTTWRPRLQPTLSPRADSIEPKPETTTEYKYKDLVEPYIIPQPQYIPMRHAAGTHYVKVDRDQNAHDRLIEDYKRLFDRDSRPVLPGYAPPPKF